MNAGSSSVVATSLDGRPSGPIWSFHESVWISFVEATADATYAPSAPFRVNHEPQSQPTMRSVSSRSRTPFPLESVPNVTSTLFEGVARHDRSKTKRPAESSAAVNGTLVETSVSACAAGGRDAGTAVRAQAARAAHALKNKIEYVPQRWIDMPISFQEPV